MLRIDELITILRDIRYRFGNLQVCKVGHYGGIHDMYPTDIRVEEAQEGVFGDGKKHTVLDIDTPDIGPEPD